MGIHKKPKQISVEEADEMIRLRNQLIEEFKGVKRSKMGLYNKYRQQEQPVIDAINNLGNKLEKVIEHEHSTSLVPVTSTSTSTPTSTKAITQYAISSIGPIVSKYLGLSKQKNAGDSVFGFVGGDDGKIYIGDSEVIFDNDNLIIKGTKYKATEGLMALLTMKNGPNKYEPDDMLNYGQILIDTNCMYQNNDPSTKRPKSSTGKKYLSTIKPIWERMTSDSKSKSKQYFSPKTPKRGSGMRIYSEVPEKYIWMNDVEKLVDRLLVISGEEESGNDNFYNEKESILKMLCNMFSNFVLENPKNMKYVIQFIRLLPSRFWGKGLVNDIINNLPFELHVPGYQYCGPGTKLDKRLARGDPGINPLDAACKNHDLAYREHKDLESRHVADRVLEHQAIGRLFSKDASISERLTSLGTAAVMHTKIHFGWGWL